MNEAPTTSDTTFRGRYLRWENVAEYVIVIAIILESIVFASIAPQFLSIPNLVNVALSIAITGILAVGMTFVILTGGIDLSVGSVAALAGVAAAMLAGTSGVLASRLGAGVPNAGLQYELDVIAAVVVGGTSLTGGRGSVIGTLWGAIFIGVLNNGMNLAAIDPYMQKIALGVVILLAVLADNLNKSRSGLRT